VTKELPATTKIQPQHLLVNTNQLGSKANLNIKECLIISGSKLALLDRISHMFQYVLSCTLLLALQCTKQLPITDHLVTESIFSRLPNL